MIPLALGHCVCKSVNMRHDVVAEFLFVILCFFKIDLSHAVSMASICCIGDRKAELFLRFGEGKPEFAPNEILEIWGKELRHFLACIAMG